MKITLRVQYKAERARSLAAQRNETSPVPKYLEDLSQDLDRYNIPRPQRVEPIWQTGFVLSIWNVEVNSDLHKAIQRGFQNVLHAKDTLEGRMIGHMALQDGEHYLTTSPTKVTKHNNHGFVKPKPTYPNLSLNNKTPYATTTSLEPSSSSGAGKAPLPPTSIKMARRSVSPISSRPPPNGPRNMLLASPMHRKYRSVSAEKVPGPSHVQLRESSYTPIGRQESAGFQRIDTTQALTQLSQSLAIQNLLQNSSDEPPVKAESEPPPPPPPVASLRIPPLRPPTAASTTPASAFSSSSGAPSASTRTGTGTLAPPSTSNGAALAVTRDLWDVRRQLTALRAREATLAAELKKLGAKITAADEPSVPTQHEVLALRAQVRRGAAARNVAEAALLDERRRRVRAESTLDDVRSERAAPFVVPALMDAFTKLAQLTGDALEGLDYGPGR
ncbi:hypothetical protein B0H21DRAFT_433027 [Amylocystis lapponica]|nr:hypothetical protein B0H21DRAFT_433027 [Amylocystis lapponica]